MIDIAPSRIDELLSKACPLSESNNDMSSSIWNFLHQVINARLAQDLKLHYKNNFSIQHEVPQGRSRYDIKITTGYQNKLILNNQNLVVIDTKTGSAKLYQSCVYSVQNNCPAIIAEFLSGYIHIIEPDIAKKILDKIEPELQKVNDLKTAGMTIPGADCRFCTKLCKDRFTDYVPYNVPPEEYAKRAYQLEVNYPIVRDKIFEYVDRLLLNFSK